VSNRAADPVQFKVPVRGEQCHIRMAPNNASKIIHNRVALVAEESVSGLPAAAGRRTRQENPSMRIYIIGSDGIALCREAAAAVNDGEIVVASKAELYAAQLSGQTAFGLVERAARCR
jgi:hypothetical protein